MPNHSLSSRGRVLVIGDSFIGRARDAFEAKLWKLPNNISIEFAYDRAGRDKLLTVDVVIQQIPEIVIQSTHHLIVMSIGSNDLITYNRTPQEIADDVIRAAREALNAGGSRVVILAALPRVGDALTHKYSKYKKAIRRRTMGYAEAAELYQDRVDAFNDYLHLTLLNEPRIIFRHHLGMFNRQDALAGLGRDGVHLNRRGLHKYCHSLKSRILVELPVARGVSRDRRFIEHEEQ